MGIQAVAIRGPFSPAQFTLLMQTLQEIDDQNPDARYEVVSIDPETNAFDTADRLLRELLPVRPAAFGPKLTHAQCLAQAVLLFWRGGEWGDAERRQWRQLTGTDEATTKTLCDLARRILGTE